MARTTIEDKALRLLNAFEAAGKPVFRVTIEGSKIALDFEPEADAATDEFAKLEMRHDKA